MAKTVCIVGTMDTKGIEFGFIKTQVESAGFQRVFINTAYGSTAINTGHLRR